MFRKFSFLILAFILVGDSAKADIVFSDSTFNDSDWSITLSPGTSNGTATGIQVVAGGNPDEYRSVSHTVTSLPGLVQAFHLNSSFFYDPAVSGAIGSLDWSIDFRNFQSGQAVALAFAQNGDLFLADVFVTTSFGTGNWFDHQLTGIAHGDVSGIGGAIPDFSSSGSPITFGFFTANSGEVDTFVTGYDNLEITVRSAVPEPASGLAGLVCFSALLFMNRRRRAG